MNRTPLVGSALGAAGLAFLVLRALLFGPAGQSPASGNAPPKAGTAAASNQTVSKVLPRSGPWLASQEHFAGIAGCETLAETQESFARSSGSKNAARSPKVIPPRRNLWCIPDSVPVQAMIAIVPDPIRSHLPLVFDRSVEAIQLAAESMKYVSDRYWLPWQAEAGESMMADAAGISMTSRQERQQEPGVMLFRWNGDVNEGRPKLLFIFIVGDTPATGINGRQFSKATEYIEDICQGGTSLGCKSEDPVRILGPTFSGSLQTLVELTQPRDPDDPKKFLAYSGTVSSECTEERLFLREWTKFSPCPQPRAGGQRPQHLTFHSLVNSTEFSVKRFLAFLAGKNHIHCDGSPPEVAILSEAGTAYGSSEKTTRATQQLSEDEEEKEHRNPDQLECSYVSFSYSREISNLRNAYQGMPTDASQQTSSSGSTSYLPLILTERTNYQGDEPPDFSTSQGPLSKEAVLMKYAAEMRRGHYRYIGITGSNVLDVLFLAKFLRSSYPDARLFVLTTDLMFERETDNTSYIGTLGISTYPLVADNLDWNLSQPGWDTAKRRARLPFSDQFEQGQYNAFLKAVADLIHADPELYEDSSPFSGKDEGSSVHEHPLWVEAVGTGGYWPIQLLSDPAKAGNPDLGLAYLSPDSFTLAWQGMVLLLCLIAFAHIAVLLMASPMQGHFRGFALTRSVPAQRLFFIHCAGSSLALGLYMIVAPWFSHGRGRQLGLLATALVASLAIAGLLLASLLVTLNYRWRWLCDCRENRPGRPSVTKLRWQMILFFLVWAFAAIGGFFWHGLFESDPTLYGLFFAYRTTHLATGVSPFTPLVLMLAGIYLWSLFEVWRLRFNEGLRPRLTPASVAPKESGLPGADHEKPVTEAISGYFLKRKYSVAFGVVYLAWLLTLRPLHAFQLFERPEFGWIYEVMLLVLVAMMLTRGLRFGKIWSELRDLLVALERSPLRGAFSRLKQPGWTPIWKQGGEDAEILGMTRTFEALRRLESCEGLDRSIHEHCAVARALHGAIRKQWEWLKAERITWPAFQAAREYRRQKLRITAGFDLLETYFSELQDRFASALRGVWRLLRQHWEGNLPGFPPVQIEQLEDYAALRYVAFIRSVLVHMKHSLIFLGLSFSLVLLSLNIYSFEPHQSLIWSLTVIFFVVGFTVVRALVQMHRNHVLSLITGTEPNELGVDFYLRVAGYGAVPLLTLIATHFPSIGRYLLSLLQPGLEALK